MKAPSCLVPPADAADDAIPDAGQPSTPREQLAIKKAHTHLSEIATALETMGDRVACEHIVLKHLSMKYPRVQVLELVAAGIPARFSDRIRVFL